jgi:hypothetical protein
MTLSRFFLVRPDNWRERLARPTRASNGPQTRDEWGCQRTRVTRSEWLPQNAVMQGGQDARRRGGYPSRVTGRAERAGRGERFLHTPLNLVIRPISSGEVFSFIGLSLAILQTIKDYHLFAIQSLDLHLWVFFQSWKHHALLSRFLIYDLFL